MYWLALVFGLFLGGPDQTALSLSLAKAPATDTVSKPAPQQNGRVHASEGTVPIPPN